MSMKNSNNTIGNRTRDLPDCSAVHHPTAPPAACPNYKSTNGDIFDSCISGLRCQPSEAELHIQCYRYTVSARCDLRFIIR